MTSYFSYLGGIDGNREPAVALQRSQAYIYVLVLCGSKVLALVLFGAVGSQVRRKVWPVKFN